MKYLLLTEKRKKTESTLLKEFRFYKIMIKNLIFKVYVGEKKS